MSAHLDIDFTELDEKDLKNKPENDDSEACMPESFEVSSLMEDTEAQIQRSLRETGAIDQVTVNKE